jgi:nitroreductase
MNTLEAIFTRRSIRKFLNKSVADDILQEIVKAGMYAPSAHNEQPWHFVIIKDRKILDEIPTFQPYSDMCKSATCAIIVCGDLSLEKSQGNWPQDCAAATQNILLAIHDLGLGGVWASIYPREERMKRHQELLKLPQNILPFALIPLGYTDEKPKTVDRFKKERIIYR